MLMPILSLIVGLVVLVYSADKFVDGAAHVARHFKVSPLLIGMIVIGFGTSAPEMVVSVISAYQGDSGIALGNAYGSNITNIGLILGLTALIRPVGVHSIILKKELPILTLITALSVFLLWDLHLGRIDGVVLLIALGILLYWTVSQDQKKEPDHLATDVEEDLNSSEGSIKKSSFELFFGLIFLILSSRLFVWGAVEIARSMGVSNIVIGLTVVAIGTSLPELASSFAAARKGESDLVMGNILGSNLFNTLAVVGLAGVIHPLGIDVIVLNRDLLIMSAFTLSLFIFGYGFKKEGRINRFEGGLLLLSYLAYSYILLA